ncbi:MAG TPA: hypothetical protein VJ385_14860 [Fibrobacteria bacterium]|nr:hypothetical protein [Fibrobacteria bacterium]
MQNDSFEKSQRYLTQLLGYLEGLYSAMDGESAEAGPSGPAGLPARLGAILTDSGYLEGLHLKAQGCLSSDLLEFIRGIGYSFEIEAAPLGAFKLPFVDNELVIQRKTLNVFMEKAWLVYHAALLSAYTLKPLRFERVPSADGLEEVVRVREAPPEAGDGHAPSVGADTVHHLNNALAGITSYVSLILEERKQDRDLQEKLGLVLEAAKKAAAILPNWE